MKKILLPAFILAAGLVLCCYIRKDEPVNPHTFNYDRSCRWIDENTLEITATGYADDKYADKGEIVKENAACSAAKINAMAIGAYVLDGESSGEIAVIVKGGKTVSRTYSPAYRTCTTVYRISRKNLFSYKRHFNQPKEWEDTLQETDTGDDAGFDE